MRLFSYEKISYLNTSKMWSTTYDEKNKLWKGSDLPSCDRNVSIASVILKSLLSGGSKIAQINASTGMSLSFDDIRMRTIRVVKNLQARNLATKQIFGIVAMNHDHLAPIVFASFALGCTVYPIDILYTKFEFGQKFQKIKPKVIFCDISAYDAVLESLAELKHRAKIFTFGGQKGDSEDVEHLLAEVDDETDIIPVPVDDVNDLAAIYCSSGTTAPSKGISISHTMLLNAIAATYDWKPESNRTWLNFYSFQWFRSLIFLLSGTTTGVTRVFSAEIFCPARIFEIIEKFNVSRLMGSPYFLKHLIHSESIKSANLSSIENIILGGYKLPYELGKMMDDLLPNGTVSNRYGLTELGGTVSIEVPQFSKGSVGQLKRGNIAKIVDENGEKLGVNERGEICIKSMSMSPGYYQDELLTKKSFDEEGFFLTGDIGYFDDDGDLFVIDRKGDTFKYQAYVISLAEIEGVLLQSPQISAVCAFSSPDCDGMEAPAVAVVRAKNSNITADEIDKLISDYFFQRNKLAGGIYFVKSIPKTPSGKNLKRKVREIVLQQSAVPNISL